MYAGAVVERARPPLLVARGLGAVPSSTPRRAAGGRAIDDLQAEGLVIREGVEGDRRVWMVEITERGMEIFDEVHLAAQGIADKLVAHLKPGEPEQLMDLLTRYTYPEM